MRVKGIPRSVSGGVVVHDDNGGAKSRNSLLVTDVKNLPFAPRWPETRSKRHTFDPDDERFVLEQLSSGGSVTDDDILVRVKGRKGPYTVHSVALLREIHRRYRSRTTLEIRNCLWVLSPVLEATP